MYKDIEKAAQIRAALQDNSMFFACLLSATSPHRQKVYTCRHTYTNNLLQVSGILPLLGKNTQVLFPSQEGWKFLLETPFVSLLSSITHLLLTGSSHLEMP